MDRKNIILDRIIDMKQEFNDMKEEYLDEGININKEDYINKISFMQEKLDVLKIAILDDNAKKHCIDLKKSIENFKQDTDIGEYESKLNFIKALTELEEIVDSLRPVEVLFIIEMMFGFVKLNPLDMENMTKEKLIYLNILGDREYYADKLSNLSKEERFNDAKELLTELLEFTLESYNKNESPFDLYEKIMIINILDTIKFYLKYK